MFETEEVDIDYFTPASSTSLASIFNSKLKDDNEKEKNSLKYVPPLPPQVSEQPKLEDPKPTQCIYATALSAYEWLRDCYISKERVGFAIMKIIKTETHNIVLYDSNKITLSCLTVRQNTEINFKDTISLSYYDNQRKYWNVYPSQNEFCKIIDVLKGLNVILKPIKEKDKGPSDNNDDVDLGKQSTSTLTQQIKNENKGSDTDSSVNRKTKDSILKRMATMGQSVLPPTHLPTVNTSDSSDTNESNCPHKTRHKPSKSSNKKFVENKSEYDNIHKTQINKFVTKPITLDITTKPYNNNDQNLIPIRTFDIIQSPRNINEGNDMNMFLSEQRMSNAELRINMNRITDKLDILLDKVKDSSTSNYTQSNISNTSSHFQNDIVQKLLNEYEKKIKTYEEFIKSKGFNCDDINKTTDKNTTEQTTQASDNTTCQLDELCKQKDKEICLLKEEIQLLSAKLVTQVTNEDVQSNLIKEIKDLKQNLTTKNDEITNLNRRLQALVTDDRKNENVTNKLKEIMNDTFQNISVNFDNECQYSGAAVRSIVASVIKKTTLNSLREA